MWLMEQMWQIGSGWKPLILETGIYVWGWRVLLFYEGVVGIISTTTAGWGGREFTSGIYPEVENIFIGRKFAVSIF